MKELPDKLIIRVKVDDIINSNYSDPWNCALAKATKRLYSNKYIAVQPFHLVIDGVAHNFSKRSKKVLMTMYNLTGLRYDNADKRIKIIRDFDFIAYKVE